MQVTSDVDFAQQQYRHIVPEHVSWSKPDDSKYHTGGLATHTVFAPETSGPMQSLLPGCK